ncbi:MAG: hypothetical protein HRT80_15325 [Henriciella sp.]|nr:hypothetical protein [Henriciella sp.]
MKYGLYSLSLLLLSGASLAPLAQADNLAIVLSPNGEPDARRAEAMDAIKLATAAVELGESAIFINGLTTKTICTFNVPERRAYGSDKAKLTYNRACVGAVLNLANKGDAGASLGQLDLPRTYRMLAGSLDMDAIDAIAIFGSPVHDHVDEPSTTMAVGHIPSDGHIIASQGQSPYGMAGLEGALKGTPVHFSTDGYDWVRNSRHESMVHRFHALTAETLGAPLATFNSDREQLIARVTAGARDTAMSFERSSSQKLEMIHVALDSAPGTPIHERPISEAPLSASERRRAVDVEVGINWSCACDMDVYVRPSEDAETIYYGNVLTNEGRFYRDYRNGRELLNGLESVTLHAPVNLSEMVIGVNFYSGNAPDGVSGEVRLSVGDTTFAKPFEITATSGNAARGADAAITGQTAPDEFWVVMSGDVIVTN